jgi:2-polyprenyl-6-methoxyphenol hydroxylase-like FAD-dependent oxidoreductase
LAITSGQPQSPIHRFGFASSQRRRYERLRRFPGGLLAIGDSLASFNPIYGQGMTVAALQALALRDHLPAQDDPRRVFRAFARAIDVPWRLTTAADLSVPGTEGRRTVSGRLANRYVGRLQARAADDAGLARAFLRVTSLVDRPEALLRPGIAGRVLRPRRVRAVRSTCADRSAPTRNRT